MNSLFGCFRAYIKIGSSKIIWIFLFAFVFYIVLRLIEREKKKRLCLGMLSIVSSFVFIMTLFGRVKGEHGAILTPFESYVIAFSGNAPEQQLQIIMNIVMYIPLGFLLPCCFQIFEKTRYVLLTALICSGIIELIQLIFKIGLFEVDDIINNTLGSAIGVTLYILSSHIKKAIRKKRQNCK